MGVAALATMTAFAGPAHADYGSSWISDLDPATIIVRSDGETYTSIAQGPMAITGAITLKFDAETLGRVKSWAAWPELRAEDAAEEIHNREPLIPSIEYRGYGYSESYPIGDRPKSVEHTKVLRLPRNAYDTFAVSACNALAHRLRDEAGMNDQELFSRNRTVRVRVGTGHTWEMTGAAGSQDPVPAVGGAAADPEREKVRIVCQKAPSRVPEVVEEPEVKKAEILTVDDKSGHVGSCGMKIDARITTNRTNEEVKFRYISDQGYESEIKTINTGGGTTAILQHNYDLPGAGDYVGKIRIEGVSSNFASAWKNYDINCGGPTNELLTLLPPKATLLEAHTTGDEVYHDGLICPAKVKLFGVIKGRGPFSGNARLAVGPTLQGQMPFTIEDGQTRVVEAEMDLSWEGEDHSQNLNMALVLRNEQSVVISKLQRTQTIACHPSPKAAVFTVVVDEEISHQGAICPSVVTVIGRVDGRGKATGTVTLGAGGNQIAEKPYSFEDDEKKPFAGKYQLSWANRPAGEQNVPLTMVVRDALGQQVGGLQSIKTFACKAAGGAVAGLSPAKPKPPQQAGNSAAVGKATLVPAAGFAIQAPKGRVRQGKIKLSGGKANAKYALRFYRKTESGYQRVRSVKLPRQMTGTTASFDLKALTGSRVWRLEVCPAGSKSRKACKTSDFRLPRLKGAGKVPPPANPAIAKAFLMPGIGN